MRKIGGKALAGTLNAAKTITNLGVDYTKASIYKKQEEAKAIAVNNQAVLQRKFQDELGYELGNILQPAARNYTSLNVNPHGLQNLNSKSQNNNIYYFGLMKANVNHSATSFHERSLLSLMQKDLIKFGNSELQMLGNYFSVYYPILSSHQINLRTLRDTGVEFVLGIEVL